VKKIRRKSSYENPVNTQVAKTLTEIQGVAEILKGGVGSIQDAMMELQHDIFVVQEALEMNFWVNLRMQMMGYFGPDSELRDDPEGMMEVAQDLQQEYLATIAIAGFLASLALEDDGEP